MAYLKLAQEEIADKQNYKNILDQKPWIQRILLLMINEKLHIIGKFCI